MAITEIDEKLLVHAYQAGDERAFDTIVRTQYNALYAHALRRLSNHESAEDAVQDTLLRAYRALPNLDGDLALRAWLHRILTNVCHDEGNRRRRQHGLVEKIGALPEELEPDPVDEAVLHDTVRVMSEALQDLPDSYREALVLRYVDGLSFREVAEATGTTEENARARAHRGRVALHKVLARVMVLLALIIPGLRRTHVAAGNAPTDQAVSSGLSEHTVSIATQLTTHAVNAAPAVSRLAEMSSSLPSGKSAIAAAAMTAVAAVSVPVAVHTVNDARRPEAPPAAFAAPPSTFVPAPSTAPPTTQRSATTTTAPAPTTTTIPSSLASPFVGAVVPQDEQAVLAPVTPQTLPPATSSTTVPSSTTSTTVVGGAPVTGAADAHLGGTALVVTGVSPQFDVEGDIKLRTEDKSYNGTLSGRIHVYPDGTAESGELALDLGGIDLSLRFRGTVMATSVIGDTEATYHLVGTYRLTGADEVELNGQGDLTAQFKIRPSSSSTLELELSGRPGS